MPFPRLALPGALLLVLVSGAALASADRAVAPRPPATLMAPGRPRLHDPAAPRQPYASDPRAGTPGTPAPATTTGPWLPPVQPVTLRRRFDPPDVVWGAGHRGVDLAAAPGSMVLAPHDGVVAYVGVVAGTPVVSVDHAGGLRTTYEPVAATVRRGDQVSPGTVLGRVTAPLHCPGGCLHWGARRGEVYLDPMSLLRRPPIVLLSLDSR